MNHKLVIYENTWICLNLGSTRLVQILLNKERAHLVLLTPAIRTPFHGMLSHQNRVQGHDLLVNHIVFVDSRGSAFPSENNFPSSRFAFFQASPH